MQNFITVQFCCSIHELLSTPIWGLSINDARIGYFWYPFPPCPQSSFFQDLPPPFSVLNCHVFQHSPSPHRPWRHLRMAPTDRKEEKLARKIPGKEQNISNYNWNWKLKFSDVDNLTFSLPLNFWSHYLMGYFIPFSFNVF